MARTSRSSRSSGWFMSFMRRDVTYSHMAHGPIVPLEKPTFLERLIGRR